MRSFLGAGIAVLFVLIFLKVVSGYVEMDTLRPLAAAYVSQSIGDLGLPNILTGILITYRGFDTLGEVAVLFMVAASVGLLLKQDVKAPPAKEVEAAERKAPAPGEIIATGMQVLMPMIVVFGAYVIVNGHLSAGGGFQGGAIVASAVMLLVLAKPGSDLNVALLSVVESMAGVFYVGIGILGIILAAGFLDPRFLPKGEFGTFISAGAIPLISALLGVKVGAELSVVIDRFRGGS
ncbi:hydrogen gas-evolving membrane-bound hydrogenase subunit E [Acuticoccus kandeliae]|uniref:hydrogen gas-evolving membrane-bound hydrogenase subunit E n=1 Tax=Acuticoccus kandeliae TaxID=2073160 RepID=UPI000D3EB9B6|nr:hydrogen gas-evolving membrane-bound hydrogenase subunit E [Acuticoccus kandeliae]